MAREPPIADLVQDQVQKGLPVRLVVGGWSMAPLIWPGATVTIVRCDAGALRAGDVAAVASRGHVVCHLVTRVEWTAEGLWVHTRGLTNRGCDPPVPESCCIGRVAEVQSGPVGFRTDGRAFRAWRLVASGLARPLGWLRRRLHATLRR